MLLKVQSVFVTKTTIQDMASTTNVLIAVARFEFIPEIPHFARIDVAAANIEDKTANKSHIKSLLIARGLL